MTAICPMCRASVPVPDLDDLLDLPGVTPHAGAVLTAVWEAQGKALTSHALFDAIYADDPDGGPSSQTQCYADLRRTATALNGALAGSGVVLARLPQRGSGGRWCLRIEAA